MVRLVKNCLLVQEMQETQLRSLDRDCPLEKEMALQHSCLENPRDVGARWAAVYEVNRVRHD